VEFTRRARRGAFSLFLSFFRDGRRTARRWRFVLPFLMRAGRGEGVEMNEGQNGCFFFFPVKAPDAKSEAGGSPLS